MRKEALVLGARSGSGNIGDAIVKLSPVGWKSRGDDCSAYGFDPPPTEAFEGYDALVVTMGRTYKDHFTDVSEPTLAGVIDACLIRPLLAARRFVEVTKQPRRDPADGPLHIVLVGSYAHRHPFTNGTAYCAAKAGLDMAGKALGWELTDLGYRVHVVHPFHVQGTPMWKDVEKGVMESKGLTWQEADDYNRKDLKMPDLLTAHEVAEIIWTLITVPAMGWLSGTSVELNGGTR